MAYALTLIGQCFASAVKLWHTLPVCKYYGKILRVFWGQKIFVKG